MIKNDCYFFRREKGRERENYNLQLAMFIFESISPMSYNNEIYRLSSYA